MGYTNVALVDKIRDMYPDIEKHGISLGLDFSEEKGAYAVKLRKGGHELLTYLDKKDADECMEGVKCIYLGVKIGEFVRNFDS